MWHSEIQLERAQKRGQREYGEEKIIKTDGFRVEAAKAGYVGSRPTAADIQIRKNGGRKR